MWRVWERKVCNAGERGKNKRGVGLKSGNGPRKERGGNKRGIGMKGSKGKGGKINKG